MGFLPMMRDTVNDPKVNCEVGDGGAPKEEGKQHVLLGKNARSGPGRCRSQVITEVCLIYNCLVSRRDYLRPTTRAKSKL